MISHIDHIVLTCVDIAATRHFYTQVLQLREETFGNGRVAFHFGQQKINLHQRGAEFSPHAHLPAPGALDLCFIASEPLEQVMAHVQRCHWPIVEGPVTRTGAMGAIRSIYLRDPDLNLIEIAQYLNGADD
ncbi:MULTISPECIES: VOC family protein [Dickeya]|uniref:Biphenyl-2,3-diol 1,2-dioxygenase III-related protein n=1 Tax=Dickeya aquatica TaxID=1401087 RepID=A0A375AAS3_9GAMM|nr:MULTISPECIES: VOC family protein [Dickeya]SLM62699.1 biphenyl-2,3-diol 1,2-dioxygenase III-related protein [Dickeya aquatica]